MLQLLDGAAIVHWDIIRLFRIELAVPLRLVIFPISSAATYLQPLVVVQLRTLLLLFLPTSLEKIEAMLRLLNLYIFGKQFWRITVRARLTIFTIEPSKTIQIK